MNKTFNQMISKLKSFVSPSIKFEIKQKKGRLIQLMPSLSFWKWQNLKFPARESNSTIIHYYGIPERKQSLMALLGVDPNTLCDSTKADRKLNEAFVTEFPIRDALCLPICLNTIVKLNRPVEEIMATYASSLRRSINKQRAEYRHEALNTAVKIDKIESEMLRPYATARHDLVAAQLNPDEVRALALAKYGRFDILYQGSEAVGCHLGNTYMRKGKRYWHVNRFGYPHTVFSDYKRWGEVNSINLHLALETAIENGYDYCDYGMSLARPGAGLIEWKRRRKGFLTTYDNFNYFYLRLPKIGAAQFLWESPLFAVEGSKVTIHLGIPEDKTDEEVIARYREMSYGGLYKVYLDCVTPPSEQLIETIRSFYADQESQPIIITYLVG